MSDESKREAALDRLLDAYDVPAPPPGLVTRIVANALVARAWWRALWPFGALWQPAGGLVTAALLGLVVGLGAPAAPGQDPDDDPVAVALWSAPDMPEPPQ